MSSIFKKNIHLCFSKIKCLPTSPPLTLHDDDYDHNHHHEYKEHHFNTIYDDHPSIFSSSSTTIVGELSTSSSSSSAMESPDFSAIFASQRLFVASPGHSNSILESQTTTSGERDRVLGGGVPIKKYSPNPYADFRRSMHEMVEAKKVEMKRNLKHDDDGDYESDHLLEYLQELLLCYLNLNPKHTHKIIIEAFADILVSVMSS